MQRFVGITFAMTVTPLCNIMDYWKEEDDRLMLASRFRTKLNMLVNRSKSISIQVMLVVEAKALMLFDLIRTCSTRERFRYSNVGIKLSLTSPHRANMENNQLAVQDISNYQGMTMVNGYLAHAFLTGKKLTLWEYTKYCFSCYVCQGGWGGRS